MIEIIEHGSHAHDNDPREAKCDKCGCRFTHTREDCWWGRCVLSYYVKCPECDHEISLGDIYYN